jgi:hypothetical protein
MHEDIEQYKDKDGEGHDGNPLGHVSADIMEDQISKEDSEERCPEAEREEAGQ